MERIQPLCTLGPMHHYTPLQYVNHAEANDLYQQLNYSNPRAHVQRKPWQNHSCRSPTSLTL